MVWVSVGESGRRMSWQSVCLVSVCRVCACWVCVLGVCGCMRVGSVGYACGCVRVVLVSQ